MIQRTEAEQKCKTTAGSKANGVLLALVAVALLAAGLWLRPASRPDEPPAPAAPPKFDAQEKPASMEAAPVHRKPEPRQAAGKRRAEPPADAPVEGTFEDDDGVAVGSPETDENRPQSDEFAPTAEQELHYEKMRMFMAEARENLPLIGIRAFDPIAAAQNTHQSENVANIGGDAKAAKSVERDQRGLRDGEVWIRIDPAYSSTHREIMSRTADLYRANTGFTDEVTVVVWVGARPWVRQVFGP